MASTIKVDNVQNQPGTNIIDKCGTTITLGQSGDTVSLASGASQTGFGRTGTVDWQTGSIKTTTFTAANGEGYFANTSGGAFTMNLPAGVVGNIVSVVDYTNTFDTYNLTIAADGSEKIGGDTFDATLSTAGQSVTFVYVDAVEGWKNVQDSTSNVTGGSPFPIATGGTPCSGAVCGDYKIHTFTGPGTFCVTQAGTPSGSNTVEYIVVAGGGSGARGDGTHGGGGGGAGGFRFASPSIAPATYPAKPLAGPAAITLTAQGYPIQVGAGGAGVDGPPAYSNNGLDSVFDTITSTGGGGGGAFTPDVGKPGGSGGGAGTCSPGASCKGSGNDPATVPAQGTNGGVSVGAGYASGGGGGGALCAGTNGTTGPGASRGGAGGAGGGFPSAFGTSGQVCGGQYYFAGGGGAGPRSCATSPVPAGGIGGGGPGATPNGTAGTCNTGGGGGSGSGDGAGANGGSGIVILRYKFQ
jgi:hypothetical protein